MDILLFISITFCLLLASLKAITAADSISESQSIADNGTTLVSQDGTFEFGFFSPGKSNSRYVGIWYKKIPVQTVVWVANRLNPIENSTGILTLHSTGNLVLTNNGGLVWNSSSPLQQAHNPVAKLLNSGNFVIGNKKKAEPHACLWQSFDHPSDTFLPGMKIGWDLRSGVNYHLTAWKSPDDASPGDFSLGIVLNSYPELVMVRGSEKIWRGGPWNGLHLSSAPNLPRNLSTDAVVDFKYVSNKDEIYFTWTFKDASAIIRTVINQTSSSLELYEWVETVQTWRLYSTFPGDSCDSYGICGTNGNCTFDELIACQCLKGFRPKSPKKWNKTDWSDGCVRNKPLNCHRKGRGGDGFVRLTGLKLPDTMHTWVDETMSLQKCREKCLSNCSCTAYTNSDISGPGHGCVMWFNDLIDVRQFADGGQDLYLRLSTSELGAENGHRKKLAIVVAITIAAGSAMLLTVCYYIHRVMGNVTDEQKINNGASLDDQNLPLLEMSTIVAATANFSNNNKIGEGGFGPVYKGKLANGQEIAVKRLSKSSRQGMTEFKNEVKLIAKLQHRNLIKLLGCCIQREEKMLIYEYMPNKSLDSFIFDQAKGKLLDWLMRFNIICGIARALLYLHQDSRLRIIHRDLKPSNVLLDNKLNPKISDFGMARISGMDETEGNTNRVIGTYGYMAPEYAGNGLFSIKSDVFSFGILLLEIICGKRNRGLYEADYNLNLIGHAWMLWKEDKALELIDRNLKDSCKESEVLRCIHVSLLCAQHHPEDRPTMPCVILMLSSEMELVDPKHPGFFPKCISVGASSSSSNREQCLTNELSFSIPDPR